MSGYVIVGIVLLAACGFILIAVQLGYIDISIGILRT